MSAPSGNQNALGNKGGGRKSAYQELADARTLSEMYFGKHNLASLEKKILSGRFSIKDRQLLSALRGDNRALIAIFNKVFPDKMKITEERLPSISFVLDELEKGTEYDDKYDNLYKQQKNQYEPQEQKVEHFQESQ